MLPSIHTANALRDQEIPDQDTLQRLIHDQTNALMIIEDGAGWSTLSIALSYVTNEVGSPPENNLASARQALSKSLRLAPANPYAWTRLALFDQALGADVSKILDEWRMSRLTGPNEEGLMTPRVRLAISLWPELDSDDRRAAFQSIRSQWRNSHASVLDLADTPFSTNVIRAALAENPKDLIEFEKLHSTIKTTP